MHNRRASAIARNHASTLPSDVARVPVMMHWLWSPIGLLLLVPAPALVGSLLIPGKDYLELFGQPFLETEFTRGIAIGYFIILAIIFLLTGSSRSTATAHVQLDERAQLWLSRSVRVLAIVTFGAYIVWFGAAIARGLRPQSIVDLIQGDPGTMYILRQQYFQTLGGITTWMEAGTLLAPLTVLRAKVGIRKARYILTPLFCAVFVRALLNSERLALIEVAVSTLLAYMILRSSIPKIFHRWYTTLLLVVASWLTLLLVFAGFEYFRSWDTAKGAYDSGFWTYVTHLLVGYYATALNLASFDITIVGVHNAPTTLFDGSFYASLLGSSPAMGYQVQYGLDTFTNRSGLIVPYTALGLVGGAVLMAAIAVTLGRLAKRTSDGGPVALAIYCSSAVGILEVVRIFYFGSSRFLPILITAILLWISWKLSRASASASHRHSHKIIGMMGHASYAAGPAAPSQIHQTIDTPDSPTHN